MERLKNLNEKLKTSKEKIEIPAIEKKKSKDHLMMRRSSYIKPHYTKRVDVINQSNTKALKKISQRKSVKDNFEFVDTGFLLT